ncbi:MAG: hypothetical protein R3F59_08985 [Myxococcota bacterium]
MHWTPCVARPGAQLPLLAAILASLATPAAGADGEVILGRDRFVQLLPPDAEPPAPAPDPLVVARSTALRPRDGQLDVDASWRILAPRRAPVSLRLAGPEVRVERVDVDGEPAPVQLDAEGATVLSVLVDGPTTVRIRGTVPRDPRQGVAVSLLPAGTGQVDLPAGWVAQGAVLAADGRTLGAPAVLEVAPAPEASDRGTLVLGEVALGLTVADAEVRVRGRLRWRIARGALDRVSLTLPGAGADLAVTSPQLASVARTGDRVEVTLREPERALVALDVAWTLPAPPGESASLAVPAVALDGVFRTTAALQLARDGELDLVPRVDAEPRPGAELPAWARDLVDGTPTAAFVGPAGGDVTLLRYQPADAPPTLVDVASYTVATSAEGRLLMRALYAVRNDRGAVLRVTAPPGTSPIGARVGGDEVRLARDPDDPATWLVPLEKSVETVEGLLAFPVEVLLLGEDTAWPRRARRELVLPTVDAEVAASRLVLHLPPGWGPRQRPGRGDVVDAFTEGAGITYGFATGDARAAQAELLFQAAVDAWKSNDFDDTGVLLDQLGELGASNSEIDKLRSNVLVIEGATDAKGGKDGEALAMERRVREQAKARSDADQRAWEEELKKADQAYAAGDYEEATRSYEKALDLGEDLRKLAAEEDVSQAVANDAVAQKLERSSTVSKQKAAYKSAQSGANRDEARNEPASSTTAPAGDAKAPVLEPPTDDAGHREPLQVTASALGVVVPSVGEIVRYQRLLLPAGARWEVPVAANARRKP